MQTWLMQGFIDGVTVFLRAVVMNHHFGFLKPSNLLFTSGYQFAYVMIFELDFYILTKNVAMQVQFFCHMLANIFVVFY